MKLSITIMCVVALGTALIVGAVIVTGSHSRRQAGGHVDPHWKYKPLSEVRYSPSAS